MNDQLHYSMLIVWSDEDQAYVVSFPEWEADGLIGHMHGATYEEALHHGEEVLDMLVKSAREDGERLPSPRIYGQGVVGAHSPAPVGS